MMIRRLLSIKDLRAFSSWKDTEADRPHTFGRQTVVLGSNGSGKSTLAHALWLARRRRVEDVDDPFLAGIRVELTDGTSLKTTSLADDAFPDLEVFNEDYVRENLARAFSDEATAEPLYVLGKPDVDLEAKIEAAEKETEKREKAHKDRKKEANTAKNALNDVLDLVKTDVEELLGPSDPKKYNSNTFNRTKARNLLEGERIHLTAEDLRAATDATTATASDLPEPLPSVFAPTGTAIQDLARDLALHDVTAVPIKRLEENPPIARWVEDGLPLHEDHDTCEFCRNPIDPMRMEDLRRHFDASHRELKAKVKAVRDALAAWDQKVQSLSQAWQRLGSDDRVAPFAGAEEDAIEAYWEACEAWRKTIEAFLTDRIDHPFAEVTWSPAHEPSPAVWDRLATHCSAENKLLAEKRANIEQTRIDATTRVLHHIAAKHAATYDQAVRNLSDAEDARDEAVRLHKEAADHLAELVGKRGSAHDGAPLAASLTKDLHAYFGHDQLDVEYVKNQTEAGFRIRRHGAPASNLSEGERNAIALLYFLRSLDSTGAAGDLAGSIVVVDDPVSSLDGGAILAAFSHLKTRLQPPGGALCCRQLIVLTHNFEFFRLWKHSLGNSLAKDAKKARESSIVVKDLPQRRASVLELSMRLRIEAETLHRTPRLRDFGPTPSAITSEYYYLFAKACESTHENGEGLVPFTGNSTRRLLESFLRFKLPAEANFTSAVDALAKKYDVESNVSTRVVKALHGSSHRTELDIFVAAHRTELAQEILSALEFMKKVDLDHFDGLCQATGVRPATP